MVSIILVNFNGAGLLRTCLKSIYRHTQEIPFEVIMVDNASTDESCRIIRKEFRDVLLIETEENTGFSRGNNLGASRARGEYLLFLNTDTYLLENSVRVLADFLDSHVRYGGVGPKLVFQNGQFQLSAGKLPGIAVEFTDKILYACDRRWRDTCNYLYEKWFGQPRQVGWLTGACVMVRKEAFLQVGGFDEQMFMYYEDKDLCARIVSSGWLLMYYPGTSVVHLLGASADAVDVAAIAKHYRSSQIRYYQKHHGKLQNGIMHAYLKLTGKA